MCCAKSKFILIGLLVAGVAAAATWPSASRTDVKNDTVGIPASKKSESRENEKNEMAEKTERAIAKTSNSGDEKTAAKKAGEAAAIAKSIAPASVVDAHLPMATDFTLATHDGKSLTLSKLRGKRGVLLVFFATWCPSCMEEVPGIKDFVKKSRKRDVLVYGVNYRQSQRIIDRFIKDKAINYRILLDSEGTVARDYKVRGIPLLVGINANGRIIYRGHKIPGNAEAFINQLTVPLAMASK